MNSIVPKNDHQTREGSLGIRSLASSLIIHLGVITSVYLAPSSITERFQASGKRSVVSIEMTMWTEPATASIAVVATPPEPVSFRGDSMKDSHTDDQELDSKELDIQRRPVEPARLDRDALMSSMSVKARMPGVPLLTRNELKRRDFDDSQSPRIVDVKMARERATIAHTPAPVVQPIAIPELVGVDEKSPADFSQNSPPQYPAQAVARRLEGTVLLQLEVSNQGEVESVRVLRSSGHVLLDQAASSAVIRWTGKPATRQGSNIASTEVLPIRFRL